MAVSGWGHGYFPNQQSGLAGRGAGGASQYDLYRQELRGAQRVQLQMSALQASGAFLVSPEESERMAQLHAKQRDAEEIRGNINKKASQNKPFKDQLQEEVDEWLEGVFDDN